jgi:hypothetical protein
MAHIPRTFVASVPTRRALTMAALLVVATSMSAVPAGARTSGDRVLEPSGSDLGAPTESVVRPLTPAQGCQALLDGGDGDCAVVKSTTGDLVVTVEAGPKIDEVLPDRPWTVRVYRPSSAIPDGWEVALATHGDDPYAGPLYAQVTATVSDVTGDGKDEVVLGYRSSGTGQILDYDVVGTDSSGAPQVLAHDQVYKGNVRTRHGHLVVYEPVYRRTDANCCPTWIRRDDVVFRDGAFRSRKVWKVPTREAEVPPSDIG